MTKFLLSLWLVTFSIGSFAQLLSDSIPYPFYKVEANSSNEVMSISDGTAALQLRIDMIRRAKKHIEVEYFIFNPDLAGKIISRELVAAAQRGVKVRMLLDKAPLAFKFNKFYISELMKHGIEIRLYNSAPLIFLSTIQFRNHRKLLTIDDSEAITGGRNIGDDYFDLSHEFNFNDRDIYVKGSIVKAMRDSFDAYFEHKIAKRMKILRLDKLNLDDETLLSYQEKMKQAQDFLKETSEELAARENIEAVGRSVLSSYKLYVCPETTYSTDAPGARFMKRISPHYTERYRHLRKTLRDKISAVDKAILISSPYLIHNGRTKNMMNMLLSKKVDVTLYTNSLASTDAVYVAANLYMHIKMWRRQGMKIYLHDGLWTGENKSLDLKIQQAKWGTHCKSQVYETSKYSEVMIGTYNIDHRSNFYNNEMALFCKGNDEFTKSVKDDIMTRAKLGYQVNEDGTASDKNGETKSILGSSRKKLNLMRLISLPAWILKFLL